MELRFEVMLYSNLGNENSDADRITCSRGSQVPHPYLDNGFDEFAKKDKKLGKFIVIEWKTNDVFT